MNSTLSALIGLLGGVAGLVALLFKIFEPKLTAAASALAPVALGTVLRDIPPGLKPFVLNELVAVSKDPDAAKLTVMQVAQHILAKAAPHFNGVILQDVLTALGDATYAFDAGINAAALAAGGVAPVSG